MALSTEGISFLAKGIAVSQSLRVLSLSDCMIGDDNFAGS